MNLEDSQIEVSQINLRNKGTRISGGRVYKGCVKDAFTKLSIGSIPSNYESIIYHQQQKKGFGTSQKRFQDIDNVTIKTDNDYPVCTQQNSPKINVSHSAKGYGPFIAKQKRHLMYITHSPGPGKYLGMQQLKQRKQQKRKRKIYIKQRQDLKRSQILMSKQNILMTPGPGSYEIQVSEERPGWKSSFITRDHRQAYIPRSNTPGPGCYTADPTLNQGKHQPRELPQDELFAKLHQQKIPKNKLFLAKKRSVDLPGPGFYDCQLPNFKPLYERIKISSNFMQTNKDRFNDPVDNIKQDVEDGPTPFSYQIPSKFDQTSKKLIDMSCFMSESKRNPFYGVENKLGPNLIYDGSKDHKKNYHFSIVRQWL